MPDRLRKLIEAKRRGQTVEVEEGVQRASVIDIMEALKKSLASRSKSEAETKKLPGGGLEDLLEQVLDPIRPGL